MYLLKDTAQFMKSDYVYEKENSTYLKCHQFVK
jgi:hypothetical protein